MLKELAPLTREQWLASLDGVGSDPADVMLLRQTRGPSNDSLSRGSQHASQSIDEANKQPLHIGEQLQENQPTLVMQALRNILAELPADNARLVHTNVAAIQRLTSQLLQEVARAPRALVIPRLPIADQGAHSIETHTGTEDQGAPYRDLVKHQASIIPNLPMSSVTVRPPKVIPKLPTQEAPDSLPLSRTARGGLLRPVQSLVATEGKPCSSGRVNSELPVASRPCPRQPKTDRQKPSQLTKPNSSKHACIMPALPVHNEQPLISQTELLSQGAAALKSTSSIQQVRHDNGMGSKKPGEDIAASRMRTSGSHCSSNSTAEALLDELLGPICCPQAGIASAICVALEHDRTKGGSAETSESSGSLMPLEEHGEPAPATSGHPYLHLSGKSTFSKNADTVARVREAANRRLSLYPTGQECNASVRKGARGAADQLTRMGRATTPEGLQIAAEAAVHSTAQREMPTEARKAAMQGWKNAGEHSLQGTHSVPRRGTEATFAPLVPELSKPHLTAETEGGARRQAAVLGSPKQDRLDERLRMKLHLHKQRVLRSPMCWRSGAESDDDSWPELQPEVAKGQENTWDDGCHSCKSSDHAHTSAGNVNAAAEVHKQGRRGRKGRLFQDGFDCGLCRVQIPVHMTLEEHCKDPQHIQAVAMARGLHCKACNVFSSSKKDREAHLKGSRHAANFAQCVIAEQEDTVAEISIADEEHSADPTINEVEKEHHCREEVPMAKAVARMQGRQQDKAAQPGPASKAPPAAESLPCPPAAATDPVYGPPPYAWSSRGMATAASLASMPASQPQAAATAPLPPLPPHVYHRIDTLLRKEPGLCATLDMGVMWELSNLCLLDPVRALHAVSILETSNPGRIQNPSVFFSKIISNIRYNVPERMSCNVVPQLPLEGMYSTTNRNNSFAPSMPGPYFCADPIGIGPAPFAFPPPSPPGPFPPMHHAAMHSDMPFCDVRYPSRPRTPPLPPPRLQRAPAHPQSQVPSASTSEQSDPLLQTGSSRSSQLLSQALSSTPTGSSQVSLSPQEPSSPSTHTSDWDGHDGHSPEPWATDFRQTAAAVHISMADNIPDGIKRQTVPVAQPLPVEVAKSAALPSGGDPQGLKASALGASFTADRSGLLAMARALHLREDTRRSRGFPYAAEEHTKGNQGVTTEACGVAGMPWQVTGCGSLPRADIAENVSSFGGVRKNDERDAKHWKRCTQGRRSVAAEDNVQFPDKSNSDLFWRAEKPPLMTEL